MEFAKNIDKKIRALLHPFVVDNSGQLAGTLYTRDGREKVISFSHVDHFNI